MAKKANRSEWLTQKRKEEKERNRRAGELVREVMESRPAPTPAPLRVTETQPIAEAVEELLRPYQYPPPCSSPEPPISHTWRLLDQVTYRPRIWYGGIVLLMARCDNCGGRGEFSEGAWETTVAIGDGPCPDPRSDAASHYPRLY